MRRMKKLASIFLCLLLVVSMFAACKKEEKNAATDTPNATKAPAEESKGE